MPWRVEVGDCLELLAALPENSFDALCTDPPSGTHFMGQSWDHHRGGREQWVRWMEARMRAALRVLKPGTHGVVWALPRTSHWTATALEDAGFEVRDCLTHLQGTGFPKSLDVSKALDRMAGVERAVLGLNPNDRNREPLAFGGQNPRPNLRTKSAVLTAPATGAAKEWEGWGTALKPSNEHWWLVRKPLSEPNVAANVLRWGTGGLNIDATRISTSDNLNGCAYGANKRQRKEYSSTDSIPGAVPMSRLNRGIGEYQQPQGRWPTNTLFSHEPSCGETCVEGCAVALLDAQSGSRKGMKRSVLRRGATTGNGLGYHGAVPQTVETGYGDEGGASRFFPTFRYCAKPNSGEKSAGLDGANGHPTVKSLALMEWLITLICPSGGTVIDPFAGSGSTGAAAVRNGFGFYGCDLSPEYVETARARIAHWERVK